MADLQVHRSERGISLMETLVALFILAVVCVTVLAGVYTTIKGNDVARKRITATALARTELEFVLSQPYRTGWTYTLTSPTDHPSYPTGWDASHTMPQGYTNYSITVTASNIVPGSTGSSRQTITAWSRQTTAVPSDNITIVTYQAQ